MCTYNNLQSILDTDSLKNPVHLGCLKRRTVTPPPEALRLLPQWVTWRPLERHGRLTKVPFEPSTGDHACVDRPETWDTYEAALSWFEKGRSAGIGFVFTTSDPFVGIDLDACRDPETGIIKPWAKDIINAIDSYAEISPSGTGVKIWTIGNLPEGIGGKRCAVENGNLEMYSSRRFFTYTGNRLDDCPLEIRDSREAIQSLYRDHFGSHAAPHKYKTQVDGGVSLCDEEILERARGSANGSKFSRLFDRGEWESYYKSHSEADLGLCCILAFWTKDSVLIDGLFRRSALFRPKWDRVGSGTIERAIECTPATYGTSVRASHV